MLKSTSRTALALFARFHDDDGPTGRAQDGINGGALPTRGPRKNRRQRRADKAERRANRSNPNT